MLSACPVGLRGHVTRWLLEIAPGVFVGQVPARVRDLLWDITKEHIGSGRAILVHSTSGEQRLAFKVHGHEWVPTDFDGIQLMLRPAPSAEANAVSGGVKPPPNWSKASRRRRF